MNKYKVIMGAVIIGAILGVNKILVHATERIEVITQSGFDLGYTMYVAGCTSAVHKFAPKKDIALHRSACKVKAKDLLSGLRDG